MGSVNNTMWTVAHDFGGIEISGFANIKCQFKGKDIDDFLWLRLADAIEWTTHESTRSQNKYTFMSKFAIYIAYVNIPLEIANFAMSFC